MEKKKILIFAHYYYPDVASTGQILKDQAEGMIDDFEVTVICTVPSYGGVIEQVYKTQKVYNENINGVNVIRVRVPEFRKENKISRIKNILTYFWRALKTCKQLEKMDYVFTISQPPIIGGLLGVLAKKNKHAKLIYCIQDFNPEQIIAVGYFKNKFVLKIAMALDRYSCSKSDLVITVGRDLVETLKTRFEGKRVPRHTMINNWIDENEVYPLERDNEKVLAFRGRNCFNDKFVIMYSGNIGLYYDLENIIKILGKFQNVKTSSGREVVFAFVGAGTLLENLVEYKNEHKLENVVFLPYQAKEELIYSLNSADVHWCVNAKGIKGVSCPSKAYGIMAAGKPIIGVLEKGTEVRSIIEESGCGKCCDPEDYSGIEKIIQYYLDNDEEDFLSRMGQNGRSYLENNLTKELSISKYVREIKSI